MFLVTLTLCKTIKYLLLVFSLKLKFTFDYGENWDYNRIVSLGIMNWH